MKYINFIYLFLILQITIIIIIIYLFIYLFILFNRNDGLTVFFLTVMMELLWITHCNLTLFAFLDFSFNYSFSLQVFMTVPGCFKSD